MNTPDIAEARRISARLTEGHCSLLADLFPAAEQLRALADEVERLRGSLDEVRHLHERTVIEGGRKLGEDLSDEPRAKWLLLAIHRAATGLERLRAQAAPAGLLDAAVKALAAFDESEFCGQIHLQMRELQAAVDAAPAQQADQHSCHDGCSRPGCVDARAQQAEPVAPPQAERFADMRHYLNEAHQFAAMSPRGRDCIGIALDMLDEMEAEAAPVQQAPSLTVGAEPYDSRGPTTLEGWRSAALAGEKERDYLRERLRTVDRHQGKDCWYWQNDGEDHLESMTNALPVVIRADHLRALRASHQPAQGVADQRKAFREYLRECDECAIVPDVGGAFNGGWRAALAQSPAAQGIDERAAFESEMRCEEEWGHKSLKRGKAGDYINSWTAVIWKAWQARAALAQAPAAQGAEQESEPTGTLDIIINNDDPNQIYLLKQYARTLQSRVAAQRRELARLNAVMAQEPCGEVWISPCGSVHYHPMHTLYCGTRFKVYGRPAA